MFEKLYIKDFAIINEMAIDIANGFTVITGETGAGKSIILQALSVAMGANGNQTMVKTGSKQSVIEAMVHDKHYRRLISNAGRVKSFVDEEPIPVKDYKHITNGLIDFHGQHEQQLIMNPGTHIDYLDSFCSNQKYVKELEEIFAELHETKHKLTDLQQLKVQEEEKRDLLEFQRDEINAVDPQENEDSELRVEFQKLSHVEELISSIRQINYNMIDYDQSVYNQMALIVKTLNSLTRYDKSLESINESMESILVMMKDSAEGLTDYRQSLEFNPEHLTEINDRLQAIEKLLRKYGGTIKSIHLKRSQIEDELQSLASLSEDENLLKEQIKSLEADYVRKAALIHDVRQKSLSELSKAVEKEMHSLSMPRAVFEIRISHKDDPDSFFTKDDRFVKTTPKGIDFVEFYLSANPGEKPKPLTKIASGGEISRIMLSLKTVFQHNDPIQTMVFDEIDSGISGVAAEKVAASLLKLSKTKQVICISHLPQIFDKADHHLHITKTTKDGMTLVSAEYIK